MLSIHELKTWTWKITDAEPGRSPIIGPQGHQRKAHGHPLPMSKGQVESTTGGLAEDQTRLAETTWQLRPR